MVKSERRKVQGGLEMDEKLGWKCGKAHDKLLFAYICLKWTELCRKRQKNVFTFHQRETLLKQRCDQMSYRSEELKSESIHVFMSAVVLHVGAVSQGNLFHSKVQ